MRLCLLGTGAADGWPNPFCECSSCRAATVSGLIRGQTSALIDDAMMVDCGPQAPYQALRLGESLARVRAMLFTHGHSDHFGPQALLHRSWACDRPLRVVGPEPVIEAARQWLAPDSPVRLTIVSAGDVVDIDGYRVRALPANHRVFSDGDCVLFDVQGPGGGRLLWASDTGALAESWFAQVAEAHFDVVCLEQTFGDRAANIGHTNDAGHHDASDFAQTVSQLRRCGAANADTSIIAVHLGHHNGEEEALRGGLARSGAVAGVDGQIVSVGVS